MTPEGFIPLGSVVNDLFYYEGSLDARSVRGLGVEDKKFYKLKLGSSEPIVFPGSQLKHLLGANENSELYGSIWGVKA